MAQAGLNNEKNWQSKISLDCPFKEVWWCSGVLASRLPVPGSILVPGPPQSVVWGAADHTEILFKKSKKNLGLGGL